MSYKRGTTQKFPRQTLSQHLRSKAEGSGVKSSSSSDYVAKRPFVSARGYQSDTADHSSFDDNSYGTRIRRVQVLESALEVVADQLDSLIEQLLGSEDIEEVEDGEESTQVYNSDGEGSQQLCEAAQEWL